MVKVSKKIRASIIILIAVFAISLILLIPSVIIAQENNTNDTTETTVDIPKEIKFDVVYPKLSAKAGNNFEFKFDVTYNGDEEATFDIISQAPKNWYAAVKPSYQESEITAVKLQPGKKESLKLVAYPPVLKKLQQPGDYEIKVTLKNEDLKLSQEYTFTATITAVYELDLSPKYGVLNTKATAGKDNPFIVVLKNTGSDTIENITFKSDAPQKWIVKFSPEKIEKLNADESKDIEVKITPPDKTIAGDYMLNFSVSSENASDNIDVRVTVETPSIWGWVGVAIIVVVVVGVGVIFARLGRR